MSCKYPMERDVNQILWCSIFDEDGEFSYGRNGCIWEITDTTDKERLREISNNVERR